MKTITIENEVHHRIKTLADQRGMKIKAVLDIMSKNGEKILPKKILACQSAQSPQ